LKTKVVEINAKQRMPRARGLAKKDFLKQVEEQAAQADQRTANDTTLIGKEYFRNLGINRGFYSKKRQGVADVDPKVMEPFNPIPGKPPRRVVIDRQRKLFASLDIEELLAELGIDYRNP